MGKNVSYLEESWEMRPLILLLLAEKGQRSKIWPKYPVQKELEWVKNSVAGTQKIWTLFTTISFYENEVRFLIENRIDYIYTWKCFKSIMAKVQKSLYSSTALKMATPNNYLSFPFRKFCKNMCLRVWRQHNEPSHLLQTKEMF